MPAAAPGVEEGGARRLTGLFWSCATRDTRRLVPPGSHTQTGIGILSGCSPGRLTLSSRPPSPTRDAVRSSGTGGCERQLDPAILCPACWSAVCGNRIGFAMTHGHHEIGLHTLRDQECHYVVCTFLRQDQVRGDTFALQCRANWGVISAGPVAIRPKARIIGQKRNVAEMIGPFMFILMFARCAPKLKFKLRKPAWRSIPGRSA